jgi:hypothetical protein
LVEHRIYVSGEGLAADGLAADLDAIPGVSVETRGSSDRLALDPATVSLVVAGLGTVNALIAALGGMWAAKIAASRRRSEEPAAVPVLQVHTDLEEIQITLRPNGEVIATSGALPERLEDVTEVHLSRQPA